MEELVAPQVDLHSQSSLRVRDILSSRAKWCPPCSKRWLTSTRQVRTEKGTEKYEENYFTKFVEISAAEGGIEPATKRSIAVRVIGCSETEDILEVEIKIFEGITSLLERE